MACLCRRRAAPALLGAALGLGTVPAIAVEGGIGAYFMGTRDTFAGAVPPAGTYVSFTYDHLQGEVGGLSVGGLPIKADTRLRLNLLRIGITRVFEGGLWGGAPAINLTVPLLDADLSWTAVTPPLTGAAIDDTTSGIGDLSLTALVGWRRQRLHYSAGATIYAPTAPYETASVDARNRTVDALSNGKNVWSFQPYVAATWLDTSTGFEASGAASLLASTKNAATEYQSAPALQLEGAVVQRIPSGWGFGGTGYFYQQLGDDRGAGAQRTRAALGADSLQARVAGLGPILTYNGGNLFGGKASLKVKYVSEFAAKRRFESDIFTANLSLDF